MIVRIMGEGQLKVDETDLAGSTSWTTSLEAAVERGDEAAFRPRCTRCWPARGRQAAARRRAGAVGADPAARAPPWRRCASCSTTTG